MTDIPNVRYRGRIGVTETYFSVRNFITHISLLLTSRLRLFLTSSIGDNTTNKDYGYKRENRKYAYRCVQPHC